MTETINGLLTQKPGRDPQQGEIKLFTIEHRKGKSGKPYIKVKNATAEQGGQPYRILSAEKTDFVDQHGNISFSVEVEATTAQPSAFGTARATMQQGEHAPQAPFRDYDEPSDVPVMPPQPSPPRSNGNCGVSEARKHLMQSANLQLLCIKAVDSCVAGHLPEVARTSEQFQGLVAQLFIEASSRRTTDGVNWWSYVDKMPTSPIEKPEPKDLPF